MAAPSITEGRWMAGHKSLAASDTGQWMSVFVYIDSYPVHHHRPWSATPPALFSFLLFLPLLIFLPSLSLFLCLSLSLPVIPGMTGNYLLTNPLLRTHDTNPYNNLLAETVVCNTPSPPAFHSPGAHPPSTFIILATTCVCFKAKIQHFGKCTYLLSEEELDEKIDPTPSLPGAFMHQEKV